MIGHAGVEGAQLWMHWLQSRPLAFQMSQESLQPVLKRLELKHSEGVFADVMSIVGESGQYHGTGCRTLKGSGLDHELLSTKVMGRTKLTTVAPADYLTDKDATWV